MKLFNRYYKEAAIYAWKAEEQGLLFFLALQVSNPELLRYTFVFIFK
jgi:hypothetical protein